MKYLFKLFVMLLLIQVGACSDFLNPSVEQNKSVTQGVKTEKDLQGLLEGVYDIMNGSSYYGYSFVIDGAVRSDNAFSNGAAGKFINESKFALTTTGGTENLWSSGYKAIANTNVIINSKIPVNSKVKYVKGQAHALRALIHMDLLIRFGQAYVDGSDKGIPYITTYNEGNFFPSRGTVEETWDKIGDDFEKAISMMSPEFDGSNTTLTYYGARALQARYFLAISDFSDAATAAKEVIDSGKYQLATASNYVSTWATDGSNNSIFELAFTNSDHLDPNTIARLYHVYPSFGDIECTKELYDLYSPNDVRKDLYKKDVESGHEVYRMAGKYPKAIGTDNIRVIRYAEVVLTYAEAQAELGNQPEAKTYLDKITSNRNVPNYPLASVDNIRLERRKELAMEGHRFFDLMRTGQGIQRNVNRETFNISVPFGSYRLAYPIPQSEVDANGNIKQNKGY